MKLSELFVAENLVTDLEPAPKADLLRGIIRDLDEKRMIRTADIAIGDVLEREGVMSTGIGNGVAIPHAYTDGVDKLVAGFYRVASGVDFEALDGRPVNLIFVVLGPKESRREHIKVLAKLSRLLNHADFREDLRQATDKNAVLQVFKRFGDK